MKTINQIAKFYNEPCLIEAKNRGLYFEPGFPHEVFFFDWENLSEEEKENFYEQHEGHEFLEDEDNFIPFAIFGNTEESGEELTLVNILDTQIDGTLLIDKKTGKICISDEGTLNDFADSLDGFEIKLNLMVEDDEEE